MHRTFFLSVLACAIAIASGAAAGDAPSPGDRAAIESLLHSKGFVAWGKIERDGGKWEIDDARHRDGYSYEIELERRTLRLIKLERD